MTPRASKDVLDVLFEHVAIANQVRRRGAHLRQVVVDSAYSAPRSRAADHGWLRAQLAFSGTVCTSRAIAQRRRDSRRSRGENSTPSSWRAARRLRDRECRRGRCRPHRPAERGAAAAPPSRRSCARVRRCGADRRRRAAPGISRPECEPGLHRPCADSGSAVAACRQLPTHAALEAAPARRCPAASDCSIAALSCSRRPMAPRPAAGCAGAGTDRSRAASRPADTAGCCRVRRDRAFRRCSCA